MTLLQSRGPQQLRLGVEPTGFLSALGSVIGDMAVSPRAIAASCGSNVPDALLWAHSWVQRCGTVVDIGAGLGGPATFLHQLRTGPTFLVEPDVTVAGYARSFTGLPTVAAPAERLPFPDSSFEGAVALAMLSQTEDRDTALAETARIVRPGGHVSVWAYVSSVGDEMEAESTEFTTLSRLESEFLRAGLEVVDWTAADRFTRDEMWDEIQSQARNRVEALFGSVDAVAAEIRENERLAAEIEAGNVSSVLYRLVVR